MYSQGPYNIGKPGGPSGLFWSVVSQQGTVVAMQITTEDNARLIAAAPDLLAACQAALEDGEEYRLSEMIKRRLRQAIDKAVEAS